MNVHLIVEVVSVKSIRWMKTDTPSRYRMKWRQFTDRQIEMVFESQC